MIGSRMIRGGNLRCCCLAWRLVTSTDGSCALGRRSIFSATCPLLERKIVNVPTMGDSITEGTIVEWTAAVGQAVKEGDVVALVETDKVTVDIKAEMDGVIVQQFGAVDDNIEVGASLYEIDTEAEGTVAAPTETAENAEVEETTTETEILSTPISDATVVEASSHSRSPSIHFLGKDGWKKRLSGMDESPVVSVSPASPTSVVTVQGAIDPMYGRPIFTEKEMEALIMGGAETAPKVVSKSGGAQFAT